jgi:hypothetical protein
MSGARTATGTTRSRLIYIERAGVTPWVTITPEAGAAWRYVVARNLAFDLEILRIGSLSKETKSPGHGEHERGAKH